MPAVTVQFHSEAATRAIQQYNWRAARAVARAMNRSAASGRTLINSLIAKDMGTAVKFVRERTSVRQATASNLVAQIAASATREHLFDFKAKGPYPSRGRGRGVTARLPTGAGLYPHAFIAKMPTGHWGVFQRSPTKFMRGRRKRQAIYELHGPSIVRVFDKFRGEAHARAMEQMVKNLRSELKFAASAEGAAV
jgi:hypothetical protein